MVKTEIFDDEWVFELSRDAKFLYLFFIVNKNTEISGYYKIAIHEIMMYTKFEKDEVLKLLKEIEPKVYYVDGWVIMAKYEEHQNVKNNPKVQKSIEKYKEKIPTHILNYKSQIINHKSEGIDRVSIPYESEIPKKAQQKEEYGEFKRVLLTKEEYDKLVDKLGTKQTEAMIEEVDTGIESKGYKYKSHYATILSWARRKGISAKGADKKKYDL